MPLTGNEAAFKGIIEHYNGPATCVMAKPEKCQHEARFMVVLAFRPAKSDGVMPVALLGLGLCPAHCTVKFPEDIDDGSNGEKGIIAIAKKTAKIAHHTTLDLARTEVVYLPLPLRQ